MTRRPVRRLPARIAPPPSWWQTATCPDCASEDLWRRTDVDPAGQPAGTVSYWCKGCDWRRTFRADVPLRDQVTS